MQLSVLTNDLDLAASGSQSPGAPAAAGTEAGAWSFAELAGRLVELCADQAGAVLSWTAGLLRDAQRAGEPVVWITPVEHAFFPPDLAASGVDLSALPVVRVDGAQQAGRAADKLLRSGAFGLVVVDLDQGAGVPTPLLARLGGLVRKHHSALLFLTRSERPERTLGSLISLRVQAHRRVDDGAYVCELQASKDRRRGPGWVHAAPYAAPPGLFPAPRLTSSWLSVVG